MLVYIVVDETEHEPQLFAVATREGALEKVEELLEGQGRRLSSISFPDGRTAESWGKGDGQFVQLWTLPVGVW